MARARGFNLTAEINLRGPSNIRTVVADIRRQLGSVSVDINPRISPTASRTINTLNNALIGLNRTLSTTQVNANNAASALNNLGRAVAGIANQGNIQALNNAATACQTINQNANRAAQGLGGATTQMEEFGRQSALAVRRFAAFSLATNAIFSLIGAVNSGIRTFIEFDKEFVRLQQVTGESAKGLQGLSNQITSLATSLGVASTELTTVAVTLAQAGLSSKDTAKALQALAKSALAPSFDNLNQTVEGSIALMRQFGIGAGDLETALGSVNAVAAQFAVEASDLITAIQRTGGVFATSSKGVSEGTQALNEFLAIFTSIRATTRESAETIATGLRTIFTRIQRGGTIEALKDYGVILTDLEGKFVGPYEAVRRLSEGLSQLDPRDIRFSQIIEELGGFRQIGKVIPLIQQFATAQQALNVAQAGGASLAKDAATAQLSIANQIAKVREEFLALIKSIGESDSFRAFIRLSLDLASALIKVADAAKVLLPSIAALTAIRGVSALTQYATGFGRGLGGGRRRGFASGGLVPGSGNSDSVSAMLTPGEYVIRKKAVQSIGVDNLHNINKYARGGLVQYFQKAGGVKPLSRSQQQTLQSLTSISNAGGSLNKYQRDDLKKLTARQKAWEEAQPALRSAESAKNMDILAGGMSVPNSRLLRSSSVGYAILSTGKGGKLSQANVPVTSTDILSSVSKEPTIQSFLRTALSSRGTTGYTLYRQGLSPEISKEFNIAIDKGLLKGINTTVSTLSKGVLAPLNLGPIRGKEAKGLIAGINPGAKASFFEEILTSAKGREPYDNRPDDANRPFDFPNGLGRAQGLFPGLPSAYVDAKSSAGSASLKGMAKKIGYQIYLESTGQTIGSAQKTQKRNKKAYGGMIGRYASGGNVDTVPAMLTPGEYVINKRAASKLGSATLNRLNNADRIPGFNKGGYVGVQKFADGGEVFSGQNIAFAIAGITGLTAIFMSWSRILPVITQNLDRFSNVIRSSTAASQGLTAPTARARQLRAQGLTGQSFRDRMRGSATAERFLGVGTALTLAGSVGLDFATPLLGKETGRAVNTVGQGVLSGAGLGTTIASAIAPFTGAAAPLVLALGAVGGGLFGLFSGMKSLEQQIAEDQKSRDKEPISPEQAAQQVFERLRVESENLADVYRQVTTNVERFGLNLEEFGRQARNMTDVFVGKPAPKSGRLAEQLIPNLAMASIQETRAFGQQLVGLSGGSEVGQKLSNTLVASKVIQSVLPKILRSSTRTDEVSIRDQLRAALQAELGPATFGDDVRNILDQIDKTIEQAGGERNQQSFNELVDKGIQEITGPIIESGQQAAETIFKQYGNALDALTESTNNYANTINQIRELDLKATQIRYKAELDLKKAIGSPLSLAELNAPQTANIRQLTSGLVAGGATDPTVIGQAIIELGRTNQQLLQRREGLQGQIAGAATPELRARLTNEYDRLTLAITENGYAIESGTKALEELSASGDFAANALTKIQERQQRGRAVGSLMERMITGGPEERIQMMAQSVAFRQGRAALESGQGQQFFANEQMLKTFVEALHTFESTLPEETIKNIRRQLFTTLLGPKGMAMALPGYEKDATGATLVDDISGTISNQDKLVQSYYKAINDQLTATQQLGAVLQESANDFAAISQFYNATISRGLPQAINTNGMSRGGVVYASRGAYVHYQPKGTDTVPAMLSPGEFVVNANSTSKHLPLLKAINRANGGPVNRFRQYDPRGRPEPEATRAQTTGRAPERQDRIPGTFSTYGTNVYRAFNPFADTTRDTSESGASGDLSGYTTAGRFGTSAAYLAGIGLAGIGATGALGIGGTGAAGVGTTTTAAGATGATTTAATTGGTAAGAGYATMAGTVGTPTGSLVLASGGYSATGTGSLLAASQTAPITMVGAATAGTTGVTGTTSLAIPLTALGIGSVGATSAIVTNTANNINTNQAAPTRRSVAAIEDNQSNDTPAQAVAAMPTPQTSAASTTSSQQVPDFYEMISNTQTYGTPNPSPQLREEFAARERMQQRIAEADDSMPVRRETPIPVRPLSRRQQMLANRRSAYQAMMASRRARFAQRNAPSQDYQRNFTARMRDRREARFVTSGTGQGRGLRLGRNMQAFSTGGMVGHGSDTIPAMLTPGEFVVNRQAASENLPLLHAMNGGKVGYYQNGGQVGVANGGPTGGLMTIDSAAKTSMDTFGSMLNTFSQSFGSYIDKLSNIKIPDKIEMIGKHTVEVNVTGAAAFEAIETGVKNLIHTEISKKMETIWNQSGGKLGEPALKNAVDNTAQYGGQV